MENQERTELILIRHGETDWNTDGRMQGYADIALNDTGIGQARAVASRLAIEPFDALYSSDLKRALQTAEMIAEGTGHRIISDARLRERNMGIFSGNTLSEARMKFPEVYRQFSGGDVDYVIPEGESMRQKHLRNLEGITDIVRQNPGKRVVVVAHGGVLESLMREVLGISLEAPRRFRLYNGALHVFYFQNKNWILSTWGDISHLNGIISRDRW